MGKASFYIIFTWNAPLSQNQASLVQKPSSGISHLLLWSSTTSFPSPCDIWSAGSDSSKWWEFHAPAKSKDQICDMRHENLTGRNFSGCTDQRRAGKAVDNKNRVGLSSSRADRQEQRPWTCTGFSTTQWSLLLRSVIPRDEFIALASNGN